MLLIIGYLTFYFEITDFNVSSFYRELKKLFPLTFQDRIMVSLTLMLVIVTIVSVIQMNLPVTPYLKMIDVWLFIATNMMVYLLMFHTFLEYTIKKKTNNNISIQDIFFTRKNSKWGDMSATQTRWTKQ